MKTVFAKKVYTSSTFLENRIIYSDKGKITDIKSAQGGTADHYADCLSAAFLDLQVNGGSEYNFTEKGDVKTVQDINDSCGDLGTGFILPTLITSPLENILRGIEAVKNYQQKFPDSGILGMHLEGPFISPKKKGAHALSWVRRPSNKELEEIIRYGKGVIRLMTIAPEVFTDSQLDMLLHSGITISAGHSSATYEEAVHSFNRGIKLITHLYNAMSPFIPRSPGLVGAAFDTPVVATPMILDGLHSHFPAARMAYKMKPEKLFFISDVLFVGKKRKHFQWGGFNATLKNGHYVNDEGHFAGSTISLGDAVRNAVYEVGISLTEAIDMVTRRPADAIGIEQSIGSVAPGYPAVFTIFEPNLHTFKILHL